MSRWAQLIAAHCVKVEQYNSGRLAYFHIFTVSSSRRYEVHINYGGLTYRCDRLKGACILYDDADTFSRISAPAALATALLDTLSPTQKARFIDAFIEAKDDEDLLF